MAGISRAKEIYAQEGLLSLLRKTKNYVCRNVLGLNLHKRYLWFKSSSHTAAYNQWMDQRVEEKGKEAVGPWGKGFGKKQFEFLKGKGLEAEHVLLYIGCGSLRGGRYLSNILTGGITQEWT